MTPFKGQLLFILFYLDPVVVLDFQSLYPSIIIGKLLPGVLKVNTLVNYNFNGDRIFLE